MPMKTARLQITSGTKDPPEEKHIKLTKIDKNALILIMTTEKHNKT